MRNVLLALFVSLFLFGVLSAQISSTGPLGGSLGSASCANGSTQCDLNNPNTYQVCTSGIWQSYLCPTFHTCQSGSCVPIIICTADARRCVPGTPAAYEFCSSGTRWVGSQCPGSQICQEPNGQCIDSVVSGSGTTTTSPNPDLTVPGCTDGARRCVFNMPNAFQICNGGAWQSSMCNDPNMVCQEPNGQCVLPVPSSNTGPATTSNQLPNTVSPSSSGATTTNSSSSSGSSGGSGSGGSGSSGSNANGGGFVDACQLWRDWFETKVTTNQENDSTGRIRNCTHTEYTRYCDKNGQIDKNTVETKSSDNCTVWAEQFKYVYFKSETKNEQSGVQCRSCQVDQYIYTLMPSGTVDRSKIQVNTTCGSWVACPAANNEVVLTPKDSSKPPQNSAEFLSQYWPIFAVVLVIVVGVLFYVANPNILRRKDESA